MTAGNVAMPTANEIGARLRSRRQSRGISLRKVAQDVGISASLLSQVETGKTQPSVATLYALASLLSISVDELMGLQTERAEAPVRPLAAVTVQRAADNPVIEMENGVRWERLAMGQGGPADALLVTYQPGASSSIEGKLMRHAGTEYAYLLSGSITLQAEFDTVVLDAGDSVHFDSSRPHMFFNDGDTPATGVWFVIGRHEPGAGRTPDASATLSRARSAVEVLHRLDALD